METGIDSFMFRSKGSAIDKSSRVGIEAGNDRSGVSTWKEGSKLRYKKRKRNFEGMFCTLCIDIWKVELYAVASECGI